MEEPSVLLAAAGFGIIAVTVGLLLWNKASPIVAMVLVPIVGALVTGFSFSEIGDFFDAGANQVMSVVIMFIFAITFFGILTDAGIFDPLIRGLILVSRGNVILVTVATGVMGAIASLDGSAATTWLITVPALLGLYQALHMSRYLLLLMIAMGIGIVNTLPWGGPLGRTSAVTGIDLMELYGPLIPLQGVSLLILIVLGILLGIREKRRIAKRVAAGEISDTRHVNVREIADQFSEDQRSKREAEGVGARTSKVVFIANIVLAVCVLTCILAGLAKPHFAFIVAVALALPLNFSTASKQMNRVRAHAPNALMMGAVILSSAVFLGVLSESGMLEAIALSVLAVVPAGVGSYIHLAIGAFGVPLDLVLSTDAYYFSFMPVVDATASQYGVSSLETSHALLIGNNIGTMVSPFAPALWLALGLAKANLGEHLRYSFLIIWGFSLTVFLAAFPLGILSL